MLGRGRSRESATGHYHATLSYPGHPDGDEDTAFPDLQAALRRAQANIESLRAEGYVVEEADTGKDETGVIGEYHAAEPDGTPIAIIEVRRCQEEGHV